MGSDDPFPEGVSAFIEKVWRMTNDPSTDELIAWSQDGQSLFIQDSTRFARAILPRYYKHNNLSSFVRQLNKYGFRKITPLEQPNCMDMPMEFAHSHFVRSKPERLIYIKRKASAKEMKDDTTCSNNNDTQDQSISNEILRLVTSQEFVDLDIANLKQEISGLKRKAVLAREKHKKLKRTLMNVLEVLNKQSRLLENILGSDQINHHGKDILKRLPSVQDIASSSDENDDDVFQYMEQRVENNSKSDDDEVFVLDSDSDGYNASEEDRQKSVMTLNSSKQGGMKRKSIEMGSFRPTPSLPPLKKRCSAPVTVRAINIAKGNGETSGLSPAKFVVTGEPGGLTKILQTNERLVLSPSAVLKIAERGKRSTGNAILHNSATNGSSRLVLVAKELKPGNITSELVLSRGPNTSRS